MKKRIIVYLFLIAFVFFGWMQETAVKQEGLKMKMTHPNVFFESRYFCFDLQPREFQPGTRIYGAVVPHHLVAYQLINEVMSYLLTEEPELIVLIGPNHQNQGAKALTSNWDWATPFGDVPVDEQIIDHLVSQIQMEIDNQYLGMEHSVGIIMPFIKYYLPESRVVPIVLHYNLTFDEIRALGQQLVQLAEKRDALILASIDFAHYLTNQEAQIKDQQTLEIIKDNNISKILTLDDQHLDGPGVLATFLYVMEELQTAGPYVLQNTNSGLIMGNNLIETTSYLTMFYYR